MELRTWAAAVACSVLLAGPGPAPVDREAQGGHRDAPAGLGRPADQARPADGWHEALGATAWPVPPPPLRLFDPPPRRWLAGPRGVDLAAPPGAVVRAPAAGVVAVAGTVVDRPVVVLRHGDLRTTLEPVVASVRVGDEVAAGRPVGHLAAGTGHCPTACLHWGLRSAAAYLDPLITLMGYRVRLLP